MNVSCGGKENICEATITITFPCIQTIMKHDMNKFNLTQFECWIWNLINLQVNRKKLKLCVFPASVILNITNQLCHHFSVIFWKMCTFSYLSFASWHLRRIKSTLVIWHIVSKPFNWLDFIWSKTWRAIEEIG